MLLWDGFGFSFFALIIRLSCMLKRWLGEPKLGTNSSSLEVSNECCYNSDSNCFLFRLLSLSGLNEFKKLSFEKIPDFTWSKFWSIVLSDYLLPILIPFERTLVNLQIFGIFLCPGTSFFSIVCLIMFYSIASASPKSIELWWMGHLSLKIRHAALFVDFDCWLPRLLLAYLDLTFVE